MQRWVTIHDVREYFPISENVKGFDAHVNDAVKFDLYSTFPEALLNLIQSELNIKQWSKLNNYTTLDSVFWKDKYYIAKNSNLNSEPPSANWDDYETMDFWGDYLKPYLIACSVSRFMLWHGRNVTQYGLRQINEDTSVEVTDKARGELKADIDNKKDYYMTRIRKKLEDVKWILDGVKYENDNYCGDTKKTRVGIFSLGKKKDRYDRYSEWF